MGIKVAVIGGGSTYTPELVEGLATRRGRLPIDELVLHDIDAQRREIVGGLAGRMLRRLDWDGRLTLSGDAGDAMDGASFVLIQLRIGGQAARLLDETLPLRFDTIGQETTGAGGLAKALRTVPIVLELAELAGRRALPGAWIVDFTNPVGIVTQALVDAGHRAIGLCNVAISLQRRLASRISVDPDALALDHVGLNHLSWITAARTDGVDRLPELLDAHGPSIAEELQLPVSLIRDLKAVPSYYLRYYYAFDEVLAEQRGGYHRAEEVMELERRLLEMYADPALDTKPALLNDRGGAFYSEAAAAAARVAPRWRRRRPGRRRPQRRRDPRARRGRRGRGAVADRPRGRASAGPGPGGSGHARADPGGEGLRAPRHPRRPVRRRRGRAQGARGAPAGRPPDRRRRAAARRVARGEPAVPPPLHRSLVSAPAPAGSRMRREIGQIPAAVERIVATADRELSAVADAIRRERPGWVMIAGRGTSDHAAIYAQYLLETHLGLPTGLAKPSVTTVYDAPVAWARRPGPRHLAVRDRAPTSWPWCVPRGRPAR